MDVKIICRSDPQHGFSDEWDGCAIGHIPGACEPPAVSLTFPLPFLDLSLLVNPATRLIPRRHRRRRPVVPTLQPEESIVSAITDHVGNGARDRPRPAQPVGYHAGTAAHGPMRPSSHALPALAVLPRHPAFSAPAFQFCRTPGRLTPPWPGAADGVLGRRREAD